MDLQDVEKLCWQKRLQVNVVQTLYQLKVQNY